MYLDSTMKIIKNIKNIKIQGASNIMFAVQDVFLKELEQFEGRKPKANLKTYFFALSKEFWKTRPTEPALKNFLTFFNIELISPKENSLSKNIKNLIEFVKTRKKKNKEAIQIIAGEFADGLKQEIIVFTHCHSSIVEAAIIAAYKKGFIKYVINTETRPLYQGRTTANKLSEAGIKVKHIIDSSVFAFIKYTKLRDNTPIVFLSGADVITNKGDLVNKIGTAQINLILEVFGIKHNVMTITNKLDLVDKNWNLSKVEIRDDDEIWENPPKNIEIKNFAFDITLASKINKIYCEDGIYIPASFVLRKKSLLTDEYLKIWNMLD
jgi:ribose 1,5-bisphosphate isomerase